LIRNEPYLLIRVGAIAALNSIEPHLMNVAAIDLFYQNEEWAKLRRPSAVQFVQRRLSALSKSLGDKPYLDGDCFTAGDLIMTTVLRILKHTDISPATSDLPPMSTAAQRGPHSSAPSMHRLEISKKLRSRTGAASSASPSQRAAANKRTRPAANQRAKVNRPVPF
jgi:glutathione S-transferase